MAIHDISVPIRPGMHIYREQPRLLALALSGDRRRSRGERLRARPRRPYRHPRRRPGPLLRRRRRHRGARPRGDARSLRRRRDRRPRGLDPIDAEALEAAAIPEGSERVLLKTTNSQLWERSEFTHDFIRLDRSGAGWVLERGIRLIGIDYLSIGDGDAHRALLAQADRRPRGPRPARDRARPLRAHLPAHAPRRRLRRRAVAGRAARPRRLSRAPGRMPRSDTCHIDYRGRWSM